MRDDKLNLGCGNDYRCGYVNLDKADIPKDVDHDLNNYPWPFPDDRFREILAFHVLEHLKSPYRAIKEIARIAAKNATIKIRVPNPSHADMYNDPTHKYPIHPNFFVLHDDVEIVDVDRVFPWPHDHNELIRLFRYHRFRFNEYRIELETKED